MKSTFLFCVLLILVGCDETKPPAPQPIGSEVKTASGSTTVLPTEWLPKTHWEHERGDIETFDKCVDDESGLIIIETMHATGDSVDPFGVYEQGAEYGEYVTAKQAKAAAAKRHPECKEPK